MAAIHYPKLAVTVDRPHDRATIVVTCDVEFTEFEVNAMNILGVRYSLQCDLLDIGAMYDHTVVTFESQVFPRLDREVTRHEHAQFETRAAMHNLHIYIFGKDALEAQLALTNVDSGAVVTKRSPVVMVDLAA